MAEASAGAAVRSGAERVSTVSAEFALKKSRRLVLWSLLGSVVIVTIAELRDGKGNAAPHPRIYVGGVVVFFMLAMLSEVAPQVAKAMAALVFVGVLFTRGEEAFAGIADVTGKGKKPGKSRPAERRSGR